MDDHTNEDHDTPAGDARLSALLSSLRREPAPEADFESRFLADFHAHLAAQKKERSSVFARIGRFFSAIWQNKAVYGTSFAGLCVMCVAYVAWLSGADDTAIAGDKVQANYSTKIQRSGKNAKAASAVLATTSLNAVPERPLFLGKESADAEVADADEDAEEVTPDEGLTPSTGAAE